MPGSRQHGLVAKVGGPAAGVAKAKLRDWKKLYEEVVKGRQVPRDADNTGAGGELPDRVNKLKEKLTRLKEKGTRHRTEETLLGVRFAPLEETRRPAIQDTTPEDTGVVVEPLPTPGPAREDKERKSRGVRDALATAAAKEAAERRREKPRKKRKRSRSHRRRRRRRDSRSSSSASRSTKTQGRSCAS